MTRSIRTLMVAVLLLVPGALRAAAVPPPLADAEVKRELSQYFARIAEHSPTVLGDLSKSPETMAAVQRRIAAMSAAEIDQFRELLAQTPDWKVAPEMFAKAFPPEVLKQMQRVGSDYAARVPRGEEMRKDVQTLVGVLKLLPDAKLKELGIDRAMVESLEGTIGGISPLQASMLHRQVTERGSWDAKSAAALEAMPPALQRGAAALAKHGALTEQDVAELTGFRTALTELLARIDKLPAEAKKTLKIDEFRSQLKQLDVAPPDLIFMVRHNVPPEMLTALEENVSFLERVANVSEKERKDLEKFREELTSAFEALERKESASGDSRSVEGILAGLGPAELMVLRDGMSKFGEWQTALPAFYGTLASPDLGRRMSLLEGETPDAAVVESLEMFRQRTFAEIDAAAGMPGIDAALVARARQELASLPLKRLELMRMTLETMSTASPKARLSAIVMHEINFGCSVDMPSPVPDISLDFICNPIEDALEAIEHSIVSTVNSIVASVKSSLESAISSVSSVLTSAINTVSATVNSLVASITDTVTKISSFIQTIPTLAWNAIKSALNLLLDIQIRSGVTLRDLVGRGVEHGLNSMKTMMGLSSGWWTAISTFTLPQIPCPPVGFHTPFGDVGDGAASANYARYHLLIENLIGMIPDTETSLQFKIPAQVLYLMYDFLGVCLEQAADDADDAQATARHNLVLTNFANLETHVRTNVAGLALATANQTTQVTNLINQQSTNVRNTVLSESSAIQALLNSRSTSTRSLISSESSEIQTFIRNESDDLRSDVDAFQTLTLRLAIESVLKAGEGREIALFQLLEPLGYLRLVSDIVRETIAAMGATSQGIGQAQKFYDDGLALMNAGKEKDAFKSLGMAYRAATSP